jgi:hypothetical protein
MPPAGSRVSFLLTRLKAWTGRRDARNAKAEHRTRWLQTFWPGSRHCFADHSSPPRRGHPFSIVFRISHAPTTRRAWISFRFFHIPGRPLIASHLALRMTLHRPLSVYQTKEAASTAMCNAR